MDQKLDPLYRDPVVDISLRPLVRWCQLEGDKYCICGGLWVPLVTDIHNQSNLGMRISQASHTISYTLQGTLLYCNVNQHIGLGEAKYIKLPHRGLSDFRAVRESPLPLSPSLTDQYSIWQQILRMSSKILMYEEIHSLGKRNLDCPCFPIVMKHRYKWVFSIPLRLQWLSILHC